MKVMIMGMDGYIGWPLAMHLAVNGHEVCGIDNMSRRVRVVEVGSWSATPIRDIHTRLKSFKKFHDKEITFHGGDVVDYSFVDEVISKELPDAIVHLAEIPSAPYSMLSVMHCNTVHMINLFGTNNILFAMHKHVPDCHLVKLGTMGEYGTPNIDIPEGVFEIEYRGRTDTLPFPRQAGSWYHLTKVHDTHNIMFACKNWKLRSTDIMQGVVHGISTEESHLDGKVQNNLITRFDFDEIWGTALNRFCAQSVIGHPLTPYGRGGQTRGYIALRDSIGCLKIAIENPPSEGEYRTFNQFEECYSINELVEHVVSVATEFDLHPTVAEVPNPRNELEEHYYNPDRENLPKLGFKPTFSLRDELRITIPTLMRYPNRIKAKESKIMPTPDLWRKVT